jgi:uncharacterized membrane protein YbhN (UPF0104 family)
MTRHKYLRNALEEFRRFRAGTAELANPPILGLTFLLSTVYMLLGGASLYLVIRALGIHGVSFGDAVAVNCFGLAFYMVLGSLEAADVGALIGFGVGKGAAVSAILVNRAFNIAGTVVIGIIVMIYLRDQWHAVRLGAGQRPSIGTRRAAAGRSEPTEKHLSKTASGGDSSFGNEIV